MMDLLKGIPEIEYNTPDDVAREIDRLKSERIRPQNQKGMNLLEYAFK